MGIKVRFRFLLYLIASGLVFHSLSSFASTETDAKSMLLKMNEAIRTGNYEMTFINANQAGYEVLRYRHSVVDKKPHAQLIYMEGPAREVLLRENKLGYFQQETEPFSLHGERIVDALPAIFYSDFSHLEDHYNFITAGRARTANRSCILIRVIDKDNTRYNQIVWVDELTNLPLRVDYLGQEGEIIEQFKVASLIISENVAKAIPVIDDLDFPPLLPVNSSKNDEFTQNWTVNWLPQGFEELSRSCNELSSSDTVVESRLFSDGIFTFTINIASIKEGAGPQYIAKGTRLVHVENRDNKEIIIIGELPLTTAKHVANSISFDK